MKQLWVIALILSLTTLPLGSYNQISQDPTDRIIQRMLSSIKKINSLTYVLTNAERFDGELISAEFSVKYLCQPKKCYINMIRPNKGSEVFYKDGSNQNQAIYNPTGFPYFTLNLDPLGPHMREQNHHTLFEAGFAYIGQIVDQIYEKDRDSFKYLGETTWDNRDCYQIVIDYEDFGFLEYTPGKGETTRTLAKKLNLNEYKIVELNPDIKKFGILKEGKRIKISNCYARRMELTIDQENYLPIQQKIYDDMGLFEVYEFADLNLNPKIDESEFDFKRTRKD